jgi:hypothetical protein
MKFKALVAGTLLCCTFAAFADDPKPGAQNPPPMDPAMMQAMMAAATPGAEQKALEEFVGTWKTTVTMWMMPGADPMTSEGSSDNRMILGNRFLEQHFTGNVMGAAFEGIGYTGYDNVRKQYWGTWMDNMSTSMMMTTGSKSGKTYSFSGSMPDPMTGKDSPVEEKVTIVDANHHTMEMWGPGPDGKMYRTMEIRYTRK